MKEEGKREEEGGEWKEKGEGERENRGIGWGRVNRGRERGGSKRKEKKGESKVETVGDAGEGREMTFKKHKRRYGRSGKEYKKKA